MAIKTAIYKGTPYLSPVGVRAGEALGNTSQMTLSVTTEKKEVADFQNPGGGLDDSFERFKSATVAFKFRHVSATVLALALGGTATAVVAAAVANEAHTVVTLDRLIDFNHLPDPAIAPVVTNVAGTTTYVAGTDYVVKRSGIVVLSTGAITAASTIHVDYTKLKAQRIQALVNLIQEGRVLFDGVNERSNQPFVAVLHRVKFGPAKSLEFIGDDFLSFDVEGELLVDDSVTGVGLSQYMEVLVGGI
ncbi:MAG TPA: hypothetical protein PKD29_01820 [Rhodocyclaceae bacterium]|nr:hypothetical protein [Rhodocyclaceae bacterium]